MWCWSSILDMKRRIVSPVRVEHTHSLLFHTHAHTLSPLFGFAAANTLSLEFSLDTVRKKKSLIFFRSLCRSAAISLFILRKKRSFYFLGYSCASPNLESTLSTRIDLPTPFTLNQLPPQNLSRARCATWTSCHSLLRSSR